MGAIAEFCPKSGPGRVGEAEKCNGTRFDPKFVKIMRQMTEEDVNCDMREKRREKRAETKL